MVVLPCIDKSGTFEENSQKKSSKKENIKYECELCDYSSVRLSQFNRHLGTRKHHENVCRTSTYEKSSVPKKSSDLQKNEEEYICEMCDVKFTTSKTYNKHLNSDRHRTMLKKLNVKDKEVKGTRKYECICGKRFNQRQGLYNHKKNCTHPSVEKLSEIIEQQQNQIFVQQEKIAYLEMKHDLEIELKNKELEHENEKINLKSLKDEVIDAMKSCGSNITNSYNNSQNTYNQRFNLNLFLNEECKNALNIMDFVQSVKVTMNEVEDVGELGYVEGISRIFVRALNELDIRERPIHCSDLKRETMYIKNENGWEKESENKPKMTNAVVHLAHKNFKAIPEWREKNPSWSQCHSKTEEQYFKITSEACGGYDDKENEKNYSKIIKKVAKEVLIKNIKE